MRNVFPLAVCCLGLLGAAALASTPPCPEKPGELNWTRRPVTFSHQTHFAALSAGKNPDALCVSCHHPVHGEAVFLTCAARGCHDNLNEKDLSLQSYFQATHKKDAENFDSCLSCHERKAGDSPAEKKRLAGCRESACHP
jgi:hypothetical protein